MPNPDIRSLEDFESLATKLSPKTLFDYYATGAGDEHTLTDSIAAFKRFRFQPRILRSGNKQELDVLIQGDSLKIPFGIAPTAVHATAHPHGESATAKAAEDLGTIMILSSISQTTIEDVRRAAPKAILWMQTYLFKDRRQTAHIVMRAEGQGFKAIVVTVDSPVVGVFRRSGKRYKDFSKAEDVKGKETRVAMEGLANFNPSPSEISKATAIGDEGLFEYARDQIENSKPKWEDISWLKKITDLPIILKGIITVENAKEAVAAGVQGIIVSAHGGRQLDGVQAPVEALPAIVEAVRRSKVEVYMDGGVRSGRDVFKALALGAKAVFIGRPIIWGLIYDGANGVRGVLEQVESELRNTMSLCGITNVSEITRDFVVHESKLISKL